MKEIIRGKKERKGKHEEKGYNNVCLIIDVSVSWKREENNQKVFENVTS